MIQDYVLFSYAMTGENGQIVGIDSLDKDECRKEKYICPNCHGEMYPTFGPKQVPHFRHNGASCKRDGYLHALAERVFMEQYQLCLENKEPFVLEYHSSLDCHRPCSHKVDEICSILHNETEIDLTKRYDRIELEKNVQVEDHFRRPDILLTNVNGDQLWVEIWVTHETIPEKRSEGKILEIKISSEADLEQFRKHKVVLPVKRSDSTRLFNFSDNIEIGVLRKTVFTPDNCEKYSDVYSKLPRRVFDKTTVQQPLQPLSIETKTDISSMEWVDLGLPSGTLWAEYNCDEILPYCPARARYLHYLPSVEQVYELKNQCQKTVDSGSQHLVLTGPNGKSIHFHLKDAFWINEYSSSRYFGQAFRIGPYDKIWVNDGDINIPLKIRLCHK